LAQLPRVFTRDATGLVRNISWFDGLFMNMGTSGPVGYAVAYTIAWVPAAFPGANLVVTILLGTLLSFSIVATYGLFSAAMPRSGGDYVFVSRTFNGSLGFLVNWTLWLWTMMWFATATNWLTTFTIVPALANIGFVTQNSSLISLSSTLSSPVWVFAIGFVAILILSAAAIKGTKYLMGIQRYIVYAAVIGSFIAIGVLLTHTRTDFVTAFNNYMNQYTGSKDSYSWMISTAAQQGFTSKGFTIADTLLALPFGYFAFGWAFASTYVGGELKGASSVKRQLGSTVGACAIIGLFTVTLVGLLENTVGREFFSSASYIFLNSPQSLNVPIPSYGMFNLLVSILSGNAIVATLINVLFIAWGLLALPVLFMWESRSVLAWSFDRVVPTRLSDVSDKYHTPVNSLILQTVLGIIFLAIYTFLPYFFSLFTLSTLAEMIFALIPVGFAAMAFPYLKKEFYSKSPSNLNIGGIPIIGITGAVMVLFLGYCAVVMLATSQYGTGLLVSVVPFTVAAAFSLGGLIIYFTSKWYHKAHGLDITKAFEEIPPE